MMSEWAGPDRLRLFYNDYESSRTSVIRQNEIWWCTPCVAHAHVADARTVLQINRCFCVDIILSHPDLLAS